MADPERGPPISRLERRFYREACSFVIYSLSFGGHASSRACPFFVVTGSMNHCVFERGIEIGPIRRQAKRLMTGRVMRDFMEQILRRKKTGLLLLAGLLFLAGCGSSSTNSNAVFNLDQGSHPSGWTTGHGASAQADLSACQTCHGNDLSGGMAGVSCMSCHANSPLADTGCTSCHGAPPSGTSAPNIKGAHAAHAALPGVGIVCDTCHSGAGSGTANHENGVVDVQISGVYNAKSGAAEYNPDGNTCSNVSCHGGQTTPAWYGGIIDVNTQCTQCHSYGTSQNNSYSSGRHDFHVNQQGFVCIACHDVTKLAQNHFTSLNSAALEGPAAATLGNLVTDYTNNTCTNRCHDPLSWFY